MFGLHEDAALAYAGIDKEVHVREITDFLVVLCEEIRNHGVVSVRIILREIIERDAGLQIERFGEEIVRKV